VVCKMKTPDWNGMAAVLDNVSTPTDFGFKKSRSAD